MNTIIGMILFACVTFLAYEIGQMTAELKMYKTIIKKFDEIYKRNNEEKREDDYE